jgi:hypothetical protein
MPVFTPPEVEDLPFHQPGHPSEMLFRYYAPRKTGVCVWKDRDGIWHEELYPSHGDETDRVYDDAATPKYTTTIPTKGLGNAVVVFLGGHVYEISDEMALELIALGYAGNIIGAPSTGDIYSGGTPADTGTDIYSGGTPDSTGTDVYSGGTP